MNEKEWERNITGEPELFLAALGNSSGTKNIQGICVYMCRNQYKYID